MKRNHDKDKRMRRWARILFFLIALVTPVAMVSIKYEMYTEINAYKITTVGLLVLGILFYRFRNSLVEWVGSWEYSGFKHVLLGLNKVIVPILIFLIVKAAQREMGTLLFVLEWVMITSVLSYIVILPIEQHYDFYIKREIRKQEMREVRDE